MDVSADSFSGAGSPAGLQSDVLLLCAPMAERESKREGGRERERTRSLVSTSPYKGANPRMGVPPS